MHILKEFAVKRMQLFFSICLPYIFQPFLSWQEENYFANCMSLLTSIFKKPQNKFFSIYNW